MRRARLPLTFVYLGLAAAVVVGGCGGGDDSSGSAPSGSKAQVFHESDTSISVKKGAKFVFALAANPSTGYSWKAVVSNPTVVRATGSKQVNPPGAQPGAEGTQRLSFTALTKGTSTLELVYDRPFAQGSPGNKDVSVSVTVT